MFYLKFLCCVSLLLGAFNLEAVKTRGQQHAEIEHRKLTRACPEIPIFDSVASIDELPSKIIIKLELPANFKISRTYPHLTEDNHIRLSSLTQLADSPQLFYNSETALYALAINSYTFSIKGTGLKITSYTNVAFIFSVTDKPDNAMYAFSDDTSEVRPTLIAKAFEISNLTEVTSHVQHHILPYKITSKGYDYLPINVKFEDEKEMTFNHVQGNLFLIH